MSSDVKQMSLSQETMMHILETCAGVGLIADDGRWNYRLAGNIAVRWWQSVWLTNERRMN